MPSASGKGPQVQQQTNAVDLLQDPLRNALQVFEKKQRNLEKRKVNFFELNLIFTYITEKGLFRC